MKQPFKDMVLAPDGMEDIVRTAMRRFKKIEIKKSRQSIVGLRKREKARIVTLYGYTSERLKAIYTTFPRIKSLHPFYRELVALIVDVNRIRANLAHLKAVVEVLNSIKKELMRKVRFAANARELSRIRREAIGRYFSVMKSIDDDLRIIREVQRKLLRLQDINPYTPTIVVAGPPNVGKSSFIRAVSRARPEVREYPFTTKNLTVGHIPLDSGVKVQVMDTPGLLDRPLTDRNPIEKQAIIAIKHLARVILFILDPTETCGYPYDYQLRVLAEIQKEFKDIPIVVALNKIDLVKDPSTLEEAKKSLFRTVDNANLVGIHEISIKERVNVDVVLETLLKLISSTS